MGSINSLVVPTNWTLEDALDMIRALQPQTRQFHFHLCLGGGVMNNGHSEKDLDLYFLPLNYNEGKPDIPGLVKWLETVWGPSENIGGGDYPETEAPYIRRRKFRYGEQRIDVFVLGSPKDALEREIQEEEEQEMRDHDVGEGEDHVMQRRVRPRGRPLGLRIPTGIPEQEVRINHVPPPANPAPTPARPMYVLDENERQFFAMDGADIVYWNATAPQAAPPAPHNPDGDTPERREGVRDALRRTFGRQRNW